MELTILSFPSDVFDHMLRNREILSPVDITAVAHSCKRFHDWTTSHLINSATWAEGYPERSSLIKTFTCYCGRIGWKVRYRCDCFVRCNSCWRKLPELLSNCILRLYCGFPCEMKCSICGKSINKENANEFNMSAGFLLCRRHWPLPHARMWYNVPKNLAHGLFPKEIANLAHGPIPWDIIAKRDPDHHILALRPD